MLLVRGWAGDSALTGTIFEEGESAPEYSGSPDTDAPYVWICDEFYEVESGGSTQTIDGRELQVAFESPMPRGFEDREEALSAAKEHLRTQFVRLGVDREDVEIEVLDEDENPI
ncbi:hypothetical protein GRX03_05635 [Halovenus sp. WSH3]|uniref:Uncharacterized protein n=1 Tax=Halovenus carboxidivorans TaxID=2692199 RepID=A0A6B0SZ45_9EURY|nr:hypothetical protein [Halovenus carboxidivorans]MXR51088.1 hypothetical protein [Halovenus carboxidivorans]